MSLERGRGLTQDESVAYEQILQGAFQPLSSIPVLIGAGADWLDRKPGEYACPDPLDHGSTPMVCIAELRDENTDLHLVAQGIKHYWRCAPPDAPCVRCERDRLRAENQELRDQITRIRRGYE